MDKDNKLMHVLKEWVIPIVVAFILYKLITNFVFFNSKIPSESMYPTLQINDRLFTSRIFSKDKLETGDIVVFFKDEKPDVLYVKRLIGMPGDVVDLKENGDVYINGELLDEPYVKNQIDQEAFEKGLYAPMQLGEYKVPEGKVFFLGDNRDNSGDSRYWSEPYISIDNIIGKPMFRLWPMNRFGKIE